MEMISMIRITIDDYPDRPGEYRLLAYDETSTPKQYIGVQDRDLDDMSKVYEDLYKLMEMYLHEGTEFYVAELV